MAVILTRINGYGSILRREVEGRGHGRFQGEFLRCLRLGRVAIHAYLVSLGDAHIDVAIRAIPLYAFDGGVEILGDGLHFTRVQIHDESLLVVVVGDGKRTAVFADSIKGFRASGKEELLAVGRVAGTTHIGHVCEEGVGRTGSQVEFQQGREGVKTGKYYAMIEIPDNFSETITNIENLGEEKPDIIYLVNEKANAIATKITNAIIFTLIICIASENTVL